MHSQKIEVDRFQIDLACLDLGEVEDVVDDVQQGIGRELDSLEIVALLAASAPFRA